jgi:hypothetical protein
MRHPRSIDLIPANIDSLSPVDAAGLMRLTIDDLAQWERLGGCCAACKRQGLVNVYHIRKNFPGRRLVELQRFLLCKGCNNRQGNRFVVRKMPRD